jgi:O-antigen/teichoic acid export membrane protein
VARGGDPETAAADGPSRVARNIGAMAGGQVVTWSMSLLWTLVVPRALGPAGMGIVVTAWSVTGVLGVVLGLGTRNYLVREMVVRREDASRLLGTALVLRVALAPLFVLAALAYLRFADVGGDARVVLWLAVAATILTQVAEPLQAAFQALERMEYLAYSDVISKSAQGLLGVVLAVAGFGAVAITGCWAAMAAVVVVLDVVWLRGRVPVVLRTNADRLARMVRQSAAYWAFGFFFTIYLWIDALMLSLLTRPEVVGWYGVPMKLFQTFMFLPVVISTAWLPRLVRAFVDGGAGRLRRTARAPVELTVVLSLPIAAAIAIAAAPVVDLLYGPSYHASVPVLVVLAFCIPPMYLNIMLNQVLVAAKRQIAWTWVMGGATVLNPALNAVLIEVTQRRYGNGAIGAAISLLLTELAIVTAGMVMAGRGVVDRRVARRIALTGVASGAACAAAVAAQPMGTVASRAFAAATFAALAFALRLMTRAEVEAVRAAARRVLAGRPALRRRAAAAAAPE